MRKGRFAFCHGDAPASRTSIINHLIFRYKYQTYLEIGCRSNKNFNKIDIAQKFSIDPDENACASFQLTSDGFFASSHAAKYDIVFIDGLHLDEQVRRDIDNSLTCLNDNGSIVLHDCNPPTEFHQRENYVVDEEMPQWNGTVWKAWVHFRATREDLSMAVVDTDHGIGVIQRGSQTILSDVDYTYPYLEANRQRALNLISVTNFIERY